MGDVQSGSNSGFHPNGKNTHNGYTLHIVDGCKIQQLQTMRNFGNFESQSFLMDQTSTGVLPRSQCSIWIYMGLAPTASTLGTGTVGTPFVRLIKAYCAGMRTFSDFISFNGEKDDQPCKCLFRSDFWDVWSCRIRTTWILYQADWSRVWGNNKQRS